MLPFYQGRKSTISAAVIHTTEQFMTLWSMNRIDFSSSGINYNYLAVAFQTFSYALRTSIVLTRIQGGQVMLSDTK